MRHELTNPRTYAEYKEMIDSLLAEGKTTGPIQTEAKVAFTRLNRRRKDRVEKTVELSEEIRNAVNNLDRPMTWLVISEAWCGDGAQSVPVIEKIAAENDKIKTVYLLRDENRELVEELLGAPDLSIPKVIAIDDASSEVLGVWGSRPKPAQELFLKLKSDGVDKDVILEEIQRWYNADKGRTLQQEFVTLLARWNERRAAAAAK
jgi:hypothetical protein